MRAKEFEVRAMLFLVIVAESAAIGLLLHRPKPVERSEFSVRPGMRMSMLIDGERFPIETQPGQTVTLLVENKKTSTPPLPPRTVINFTEEQERMSRVHEPRFRFYFDSPKTLHRLLVEEKLEKLRGRDDWDTIVNVLKWTRAQFEPGTPGTYPTKNASQLLPALRSGKEKGFCAQYCYILVQCLQALDFKARYVGVNNHEVAEVWEPRLRHWIALDPLNAAYFEDARGRKLSAYEVYRNRENVKVITDLPNLDGRKMAEAYRVLNYWLRNDLYSTRINLYDLDLYWVRLILDPQDIESLKPTALCTLFPDELYTAPESETRETAGAR